MELPHEYEWEVAARWPNNRFYPWGNEFDSGKANTGEGNYVDQTTAVGLYPHGANQELKLYDLSGNVWEWCWNKFEERDDDQVDDSDDERVLRGGSWSYLFYAARASCRSGSTPDDRYFNFGFGFRLVVGVSSPISSP